MPGSRTKACAMLTPNGLSVRSRILRISSLMTSSSPDEVSMIPIAPALDTADASCALAIQPIGACTIGISTPSISVTRLANGELIAVSLLSEDRFENRDVLGDAERDLHAQVIIAEIGVGPRLGHAAPRVAAAEERAGDRLRAELLAPRALAAGDPLEEGIAVGHLRVLGVEADLEGEHGRIGHVLRADHLRLVVLTGRAVGVEPELHAVPVGAEAHRTELRRHEPAYGLTDLVEQAEL